MASSPYGNFFIIFHIRIYKDYIKKLINNEIIDFELPDLIKLNVPNYKISQLETKIIK